jgi:hypothetical protein
MYGATGFSLSYDRAFSGSTTWCNIFHLQRDQIATPQFAVDGKIEQSQFAILFLDLKPYSDRPYLFGFQWWLLTSWMLLRRWSVVAGVLGYGDEICGHFVLLPTRPDIAQYLK